MFEVVDVLLESKCGPMLRSYSVLLFLIKVSSFNGPHLRSMPSNWPALTFLCYSSLDLESKSKYLQNQFSPTFDCTDLRLYELGIFFRTWSLESFFLPLGLLFWHSAPYPVMLSLPRAYSRPLNPHLESSNFNFDPKNLNFNLQYLILGSLKR